MTKEDIRVVFVFGLLTVIVMMLFAFSPETPDYTAQCQEFVMSGYLGDYQEKEDGIYCCKRSGVTILCYPLDILQAGKPTPTPLPRENGMEL